MIAGVPSHFFLENPAGQNGYLILCHYLKKFSERWFNRRIEDLRVLDWGCGKGQVSFLLRKAGAKVTSCDLATTSDDSSFGQETPILAKAGIPVVSLQHAFQLPFPQESFDIVLSFGVLEHVENDLASLREIHRVLVPSGLFFCFYLPYCLSWTQNLAHLLGNYYHQRLYKESTLQQLLRESDFDVLDIWHRQLFPKNTVRYPGYRLFERLDQILADDSWFRFLATNLECVAAKESRRHR
jgi:SAM-dependent methyltransferase